MATIQIEIPEEVAERARNTGLLTNNALPNLIEAEVLRREKYRAAWERLDNAFEPVRESFRAEYGHLTEDEVIEMIDGWLHEDQDVPQNADVKQATS